MGLLTQLIAQHHNDEVQKKATQVGLWKGILEDKRTPEEGGFTTDMKNHALEQMVGMANGGKDGKGAGGKGKAGEMLGVFKHLLGLNGQGDGGGKGGSAIQAAVGGGQGQVQPDQNQPQGQPSQTQAQPTPDYNLPGAPTAPGLKATPQVQAQPQPQQQPTQGQPQRQTQSQAPRPLQRSPNGLPAAFMTDDQRRARQAQLYDEDTQNQVKRQTALGDAQGAQGRTQAGLEAQMRANGVKDLVAKGIPQNEAEAIYGIKTQTPPHRVGAPSFEIRDGKPVKVTSMSDGSETVEDDITKQPTSGSSGADGLTGSAKNIKWANGHVHSADPVEAQTAQTILNEADNTRMSKDLQRKMKTVQLTNLSNSTDPGSISTLADGIKAGIGDPNLTNMSRATATLVTAKLMKDGFNLAAAKQEYSAVKTAFAALNSPQQTRIRQNVEQAKESLPLITDAGKQWADSMKLSGKNPILNSAEMGLAKQGVYGPEAQKAAVVFEGQIADVQAELSSIYMGTASPTDKAIELAQKSLKSNWSWGTLQAQLAQVDKNLDRRESAISHLTVMGAGSDSTYIPRDDKGNVQTTDQNAPGNKPTTSTPAATPPWMIQAQTKPTGSIIILPNGKKVKKTGKDTFEPIADSPGRGGK